MSKPGHRVSGDQKISVVFVANITTAVLYTGKKYINIDLANEPQPDLRRSRCRWSVETVADVDALYTQLKDAGMTEAFPGFLIDPSDLQQHPTLRRSLKDHL